MVILRSGKCLLQIILDYKIMLWYYSESLFGKNYLLLLRQIIYFFDFGIESCGIGDISQFEILSRGGQSYLNIHL